MSLTPSPIGPKTVCSNPELLKQQKEHLRKALTQCKYPKWALDKVEKKLNRSSSGAIDGVNSQGANSTPAATREVKSKGNIVIPYTQGHCESIKKICGRYGIQTHFKGGSTIKNLLVSPKDRDPMVSQSDAIYWYQCGDLTCDDEYIGETSRTFGERYKEHLKDPSPIHHHNNQTNHPINHNNFKIIGRGTICLGISRNPLLLWLISLLLTIMLVNLTYPIYGIGF